MAIHRSGGRSGLRFLVRLFLAARLRFWLGGRGRASTSPLLSSLARIEMLARSSREIGHPVKFNYDLLPATLEKLGQAAPDIAVNLFDMSPAEQLRALETRKIDLGFVGLRPAAATKNMGALAWECIAHHPIVVALPSHHPLVKRKRTNIRIEDLKPLFFVTMSEETHPGSRDWLSALCQQAGFTPRILQDVALESGLMTFVAEGLGVTLAREQIKHLPHPGVVFRPLAAPVQADYWIAWHRENPSKALEQYIEIIKLQAGVNCSVNEDP